MFFLPNASYTDSCFSTLKQKLNSTTYSIDQYAVNLCLKDQWMFLANNSHCHGIQTLKDWHLRVGPNSNSLDSYCKGDLNSSRQCDSCSAERNRLTLLLSDSNPDNDSRSCAILTVLYAAGIASEYGALNDGTANCVMGMLRDDDVEKHQTSSKGRVLKLVFGVFGGLISFLGIGFVVVVVYRNMKSQHQEPESRFDGSGDLVLGKMGLQWFSLQELERATDGFSSKNMVGKGTFGVVYRGKLDDDGSSSSLVAVKELLEVESFGNEKEFVNEVEIVSRIKHKNLLPLRGCCCADMIGKNRRRRRFLVYDFMANGSVADHLSDMSRRVQLCWEQRKSIILDVAKGLVYLHCGVKPSIYHRDIKASNILLDLDFRAKVADFGLVRQGLEDGYSHITTRVAGTHGFLAPEYAMYGHLTHKSDVYSFGVLILEIITARKVIDTSSSCSSTMLITDWAWNLVKSGKVGDIFDETMKDDEHEEEMTKFVMVGILCAHIVAAHRPTINEALKMLEGGIEVPNIPDRPSPMSRESLA
ncbi:Probable receptor-like protein kinase At1g11050 [Linum grandiflorum]